LLLLLLLLFIYTAPKSKTESEWLGSAGRQRMPTGNKNNVLRCFTDMNAVRQRVQWQRTHENSANKRNLKKVGRQPHCRSSHGFKCQCGDFKFKLN